MTRQEKIVQASMGMEFRLYDADKDYPVAKKWWIKHNSAHLEAPFLPSLGVVVTKDEKPIGMAWVYLSNSKLGEIGWVVTDPELGPKARIAAMIKLFDMAEDVARKSGCMAVQILSDRPGLTRFAMAADYTKIRTHDYMVKYLPEEDEDV